MSQIAAAFPTAQREPYGWEIFETDSGLAIERDDELGLFVDDEAAFQHVVDTPEAAHYAISYLLEQAELGNCGIVDNLDAVIKNPEAVRLTLNLLLRLANREWDATTAAPPSTDTYTVVLLYPDYLRDDPTDSFVESVDAPSAEEAVAKVRASAQEANPDSVDDPNDFALVAVLKGSLSDARAKETESAILRCPKCGETQRIEYIEDAVISRRLHGFDSDGCLHIAGNWSTGDGENGRLQCLECMHEWKIPESTEIEWD